MITKKFTITKTNNCSMCDGHKKVYSSYWSEFWKTFGDKALVEMSDDDIERWFRTKYSIETPSEEEWCPNCEGVGAITEELHFNTFEDMQDAHREKGISLIETFKSNHAAAIQYTVTPWNHPPYTHVIEASQGRFKAFILEKEGTASIEIAPVQMSAENFKHFAGLALELLNNGGTV